jgi:DNA helicase-2/ATP-dependent DNA helicase PcrA
MSGEQTFLKQYAILNEGQKKAVDTIDGPVMVVAGPGTGKTQILTMRIANILRLTDTEPENILALTFTESGVQSMRGRLSGLIGSMAYQVRITTFHGFANDAIQAYPEFFPDIIGSTPITDVDQIKLLETIIADTDLQLLKPFGDTLYYIRPILGQINTLKREGVTPEEFRIIVEKAQSVFDATEDKIHAKGAHKGKMKSAYKDEEKMLTKNQDLLQLYVQYQELLATMKHYDFSDMILSLLQAMRTDEDFLLQLQERHQYVLVDEHQDTNNAQNKILELLVNFHDSPNLFVVGDTKQSIYRFQGASLENFFYFQHLYPQAQLVTLTHNYRSSQAILDSAESLIASDHALLAQSTRNERPVSVVAHQEAVSEYLFVVEDIQSRIDDGVAPEDIAVLYRNNADAGEIASILQKKGIAHRIESDENILLQPEIQILLTYLRGAHDPTNNTLLSPVLFDSRSGVLVLDAIKITRAAHRNKKATIIDILRDTQTHEVLGIDSKQAVALSGRIIAWAGSAQRDHVMVFLERMITESGLLDQVLSHPQVTEKLALLTKFFGVGRSVAERKFDAKIGDFLEHIDTLQAHNIAIKQGSRRAIPGHVRLMTAHRSKGLEFSYVYIIKAIDGHWGNKSRRELLPLVPAVYQLFEMPETTEHADTIQDKNADERRLFYVALTRAKEHVVISYHGADMDGREKLPSQFIGEIHQELIEMQTIDDDRAQSALAQSILFQPAIVDQLSRDEKKSQMQAFAREKFLEQGLSVSALNNYLKSPWLFFFRNLVRIPSAPNKSQSFGNAVHGALQRFFDMAQDGEVPSITFLLDEFSAKLQGQLLSDTDRRDTLMKGNAVLADWYENKDGIWTTNTKNEVGIYGVFLPGTEGGDLPIRLTGVLDKLECAEDDPHHVRVVDYKTGKTKSENYVRGSTKGSNGDYYRQLVFYKLLLRYYHEGRYQMDEGVLEFIEPTDSGKYSTMVFAISDEEVDELEEQIKKAAQDIVTLGFWDTEPDPEHCEEYLDLVEKIRGE